MLRLDTKLHIENDPNEFVNKVRPYIISHKDYNKIFCIGYNKTGTTTLSQLLRLYGFNLPDQQEQEIRLTKQTFATNYDEFRRFVNHYDAFQDMPFSQEEVYIVADALFPNSKFILTERDPEAWFNSMCRFHAKGVGVDDVSELTEQDIFEKFIHIYKGYSHAQTKRFLTNYKGSDEGKADWSKLYDKEYYINEYQQRNNRIKKYFMDVPEKLLVIDVTTEQNTQKICEFLNIPDEYVIPMPHVNKT